MPQVGGMFKLHACHRNQGQMEYGSQCQTVESLFPFGIDKLLGSVHMLDCVMSTLNSHMPQGVH